MDSCKSKSMYVWQFAAAAPPSLLSLCLKQSPKYSIIHKQQQQQHLLVKSRKFSRLTASNPAQKGPGASIILKRTPLGRTIGIRLLPHQLRRQLHQLLPQRLILRQRGPGLRHRRRTQVKTRALRRGGRKHRAHAALHDVLLQRPHGGAHQIAAQRIRLVDVLGRHFRVDEPRVRRVGQDVGRGQVPRQVAHVQDRGELGAAVKTVRTEVLVQFVQGGESAVRGARLVCVGGQVHDADFAAWVFACRILHQWEQVRCEDHGRHVVHGHLCARLGSLVWVLARGWCGGFGGWNHTYVTVNTVVCQLVCHDASRGVVDENIQSVGALGDDVRRFLCLFPVG